MGKLLTLALCAGLVLQGCRNGNVLYHPSKLFNPEFVTFPNGAIEEVEENIYFFFVENGRFLNFGLCYSNSQTLGENRGVIVEAEDTDGDRNFDSVTIERNNYSQENFSSSKVSLSRGIGYTERIFELMQTLYSEFIDSRNGKKFYEKNKKSIEELCAINPDTLYPD